MPVDEPVVAAPDGLVAPSRRRRDGERTSTERTCVDDVTRRTIRERCDEQASDAGLRV